MIHKLDEVSGIVSEEVFADDTHRRVFKALLAHHAKPELAEVDLDPDAKELLSRVLVFDAALDADPRVEGLNLLRAAVRRELKRRVSNTTVEVITRDRIIKQKMDTLSGRDVRDSDVTDLLMWLYDVCSTVEA